MAMAMEGTVPSQLRKYKAQSRYQCLVVWRVRTGTLAPVKRERHLPWASAGPAFHLGGFSHLQQRVGSHMVTIILGTSSLLPLPSLLPKPSLASPAGALHPPPRSFPVWAPPDVATKLLVD